MVQDVFRIHAGQRDYTDSSEDRVDWSADDYYYASVGLKRTGRFADRIELLKEALDGVAREDFNLAENLAFALMKDGDPKEAISYAEKAWGLTGDDEYNERKIVKLRAKIAAQIHELDKVPQNEWSIDTLLHQTRRIKQKDGEKVAAEFLAKNIAERDDLDGNFLVHAQTAKLFYYGDNLESAEQYALKAKAIAPHDFKNNELHERCKTELSGQKFMTAGQLIDIAKRVKGSDGDRAGAEYLADKIEERDDLKGHFLILAQAGKMFIFGHDYQSAQWHLEEAYRIDPHDDRNLDMLRRCYRGLGIHEIEINDLEHYGRN